MEKPNNLEQPIRSLEEGEAIMEASCISCGWKSKEIFTIGDEERDMVCIKIEDSHSATGCKETSITFSEKHS